MPCLEKIMVRIGIQVSNMLEQALAMFIAFTYYLECLSYGRGSEGVGLHCSPPGIIDGRKYQTFEL